jgi:hypothetical protein
VTAAAAAVVRRWQQQAPHKSAHRGKSSCRPRSGRLVEGCGASLKAWGERSFRFIEDILARATAAGAASSLFDDMESGSTTAAAAAAAPPRRAAAWRAGAAGRGLLGLGALWVHARGHPWSPDQMGDMARRPGRVAHLVRRCGGPAESSLCSAPVRLLVSRRNIRLYSTRRARAPARFCS